MDERLNVESIKVNLLKVIKWTAKIKVDDPEILNRILSPMIELRISNLTPQSQLSLQGTFDV